MFGRLLLLFITVPLIELYLFFKIGSRIGLPYTLAIIIITGVLGAWLTKVQGLRTLARFQKATAEGRMPHEEVLDGLMILVAGAVLLTPGFLTDTVGFLLLVPAIRAIVRQGLARYVKNHVQIVTAEINPNPSSNPQAQFPSERPGTEKVIAATVIDSKPIDD
jgi:UPF0716 protein FxsA